MAMSTSVDSARVEMLADDPVEAENQLRRDYADLGTVDEKYFRSTIAALLSEALYRQGRIAEADEFSHVAEQLADPDDSAVQVWWRASQAKVLASEGRADEALELMGAAVKMARESGSPPFLGGVLEDQATMLELVGRSLAAGPPLREALSLFEQKGDLISAGRVRARLSTVPGD